MNRTCVSTGKLPVKVANANAMWQLKIGEFIFGLLVVLASLCIFCEKFRFCQKSPQNPHNNVVLFVCGMKRLSVPRRLNSCDFV